MKYFGWIFLFFIMLHILPLGNRPVLTTAEQHNSAVAAEMIQSGNYTTPMFEGQPSGDMPMTAWLTTASFKLFGHNRFASRLPAALAIGITALMTALLVQQSMRDEKLAALAATICMAFSLAVFLSNSAAEAAIFTMFTAGASGSLFLAAQELKFNRRKCFLLIIAGISSGLAFLTSGIYALLFPVLAIIFTLITSHRIKDLPVIILPYLIFSALPVLPWALKIAGENPGYWCEFFSWINFTQTIGSAASWYSYLLILLIGFFPVIILLPTVIMAGRESWQRLLRQPLCVFAILSLITGCALLTVLRNAPAAMIFTVFPALSLLIAMGIQAYFNNGGHHRSFNWMLNIWGLFLLVTGIIESFLWFTREKFLTEYANILPTTELFLINLGVTSIIGGGILLYSLRGNWRSRLYLFFFSIAILPLAISWCFNDCSNVQKPHLCLRENFIPEQLNNQ